jgi:hypothetical protein
MNLSVVYSSHYIGIDAEDDNASAFTLVRTKRFLLFLDSGFFGHCLAYKVLGLGVRG